MLRSQGRGMDTGTTLYIKRQPPHDASPTTPSFAPCHPHALASLHQSVVSRWHTFLQVQTGFFSGQPHSLSRFSFSSPATLATFFPPTTTHRAPAPKHRPACPAAARRRDRAASVTTTAATRASRRAMPRPSAASTPRSPGRPVPSTSAVHNMGKFKNTLFLSFPPQAFIVQ